jgi:tRNA nucleotidyltransferase (CCA-adding enzyme)
VHHLVHHHGEKATFSNAQVQRLARKLAPASIDDLTLVMTADSFGRPPLQSPETIALIALLRAKARALELENAAPRPLVLGRHLLALGLRPNPEFKRILAQAFEAQLDGAFTDTAGGVEWLKAHLPP